MILYLPPCRTQHTLDKEPTWLWSDELGSDSPGPVTSLWWLRVLWGSL